MSECINCGEHDRFQQLDKHNATEKPDDGLCMYCRTDRDACFAAETLPIEVTRARLALLPIADRCCDDCPGYCISESDQHGTQIETCDECVATLDRMFPLDHVTGGHRSICDDDVQLLPEAQELLRKALAHRDRYGVTTEPRKHPRVATVLTKEVVRVSIEMRPPREGECGECVTRNADPKDALAQVLDMVSDPEEPDHGILGYGFIADRDMPEYDNDPECPGRFITVIVEIENVEIEDIQLL